MHNMLQLSTVSALANMLSKMFSKQRDPVWACVSDSDNSGAALQPGRISEHHACDRCKRQNRVFGQTTCYMQVTRRQLPTSISTDSREFPSLYVDEPSSLLPDVFSSPVLKAQGGQLIAYGSVPPARQISLTGPTPIEALIWPAGRYRFGPLACCFACAWPLWCSTNLRRQ